VEETGGRVRCGADLRREVGEFGDAVHVLDTTRLSGGDTGQRGLEVLKGVVVRFGGVVALAEVSLELVEFEGGLDVLCRTQTTGVSEGECAGLGRCLVLTGIHNESRRHGQATEGEEHVVFHLEDNTEDPEG
jgi:hypothetical protein